MIVSKKDALRLVAQCAGVADKKGPMPALSNVLLAVIGNTLHVSATDLYMSISGFTDIEAADGINVGVPAKDLLDRLKSMPDGPVQILANDSSQTTLKAVGAARRYTMHGIPGSEFPKLPVASANAATVTIPLDLLTKLLSRTHFAISNDETRPHVNSMLFECKGSLVRTVATDGHRLSKMELPLPTPATTPMSVLIPLKAVTTLRGLVADARTDKSDVIICHDGPNVFFTIAGMQFSVKTVEALFPPYEQVIPKDALQLVTVPRAAFIDALRAISLAASDRTGGVRLSLAKQMLRITSESPEGGNGADEVACEYNGPDTTVGFNAKYFLDVLTAMDDDEVVLSIGGELDPGVIRSATSPDGENYISVVMPMRL